MTVLVGRVDGRDDVRVVVGGVGLGPVRREGHPVRVGRHVDGRDDLESGRVDHRHLVGVVVGHVDQRPVGGHRREERPGIDGDGLDDRVRRRVQDDDIRDRPAFRCRLVPHAHVRPGAVAAESDELWRAGVDPDGRRHLVHGRVEDGDHAGFPVGDVELPAVRRDGDEARGLPDGDRRADRRDRDRRRRRGRRRPRGRGRGRRLAASGRIVRPRAQVDGHAGGDHQQHQSDEEREVALPPRAAGPGPAGAPAGSAPTGGGEVGGAVPDGSPARGLGTWPGGTTSPVEGRPPTGSVRTPAAAVAAAASSAGARRSGDRRRTGARSRTRCRPGCTATFHVTPPRPAGAR